MDANVIFCSLMLKEARKAAKKAKVKIGKLTTWKDTSSPNGYFEVWERPQIIWQGSAFNASEAKANAIFAKIDE